MIDQFLNYLRFERNASPQTVQTYEDSLREFESYLTFRDGGLSLGTVDTDLIRDWMESLMDRGNNASTINKKLSALCPEAKSGGEGSRPRRDGSEEIETPAAVPP